MKAVPYIILVMLVVLTALLFIYRQPKEFDGRISLNYHDKIPYGTYAAYHLLSQEFPHAKIETNRDSPIEWKSLSSDSTKQVLFIVTKFFSPSETELDYLTGFVQAGNYVFLSAMQMNSTAMEFFKLRESEAFAALENFQYVHPFDPFDSFAVQLDSASFMVPFSFQYPGADFSNEFRKTDSSFSYILGYTPSFNKNLIAIHSIAGTFFLHTAPITFTNFFLLYEDNRQYFEKLISLLPANAKKVVWDEYFLSKRNNSQPKEKRSMLSVIFNYDNFRRAFWLLLALLALYLLTATKRRQRIIPKYERPVNDSLEFVTTIGKLYYEKGDHKNLAEKLTQYFFDYVRTRFKISTAEINSSFVQQLAAKSNKSIGEVNAIADSIQTIQLSDNISQKQLMDYYELLEQFYKQT